MRLYEENHKHFMNWPEFVEVEAEPVSERVECCGKCQGAFKASYSVSGMHGGNMPCRAAFNCEFHQRVEGECPCDKDEARASMCKKHYDMVYRTVPLEPVEEIEYTLRNHDYRFLIDKINELVRAFNRLMER